MTESVRGTGSETDTFLLCCSVWWLKVLSPPPSPRRHRTVDGENTNTPLWGVGGWGSGGVAGLSICFEQGASAPLLAGICLDFSIDDTQVHTCSVSIVVLVEYIWVFSPSQLVKTFCLLCYRYTLYLSLSLSLSHFVLSLCHCLFV